VSYRVHRYVGGFFIIIITINIIIVVIILDRVYHCSAWWYLIHSISSLVLITRLTRILSEIYELVVIKYRVITQAVKPKIAEWQDLEALCIFFPQVKCSRSVFLLRKPPFRQKKSYWFFVVFYPLRTRTHLSLAMSFDRLRKTEKVCVENNSRVLRAVCTYYLYYYIISITVINFNFLRRFIYDVVCSLRTYILFCNFITATSTPVSIYTVQSIFRSDLTIIFVVTIVYYIENAVRSFQFK